jgi:hypothetical protein
MLVRTFASVVTGLDAVTLTIEVNVSRCVQFFLVELPDSAVKESQHRIASAFRALNFHWPGKQVVINMAPADIRQEGSDYDLPLAPGMLSANSTVLEVAAAGGYNIIIRFGQLNYSSEIYSQLHFLPYETIIFNCIELSKSIFNKGRPSIIKNPRLSD